LVPVLVGPLFGVVIDVPAAIGACGPEARIDVCLDLDCGVLRRDGGGGAAQIGVGQTVV
jgi:hypothetical protein